MKTRTIIILSSLLLLCSCLGKEEILNQVQDDGGHPGLDPGSTVPVTLSLTVAPEQSGTPETKAITDVAATTGSSEVKNLWVIQFNGTSDDSKQIGEAHYIADYTVEANRSINLVSSTAAGTIVFIANTFNPNLPFPKGETLAKLKSRFRTVLKPSDVFGYDAEASTTDSSKDFPEDADYYFILCGSQSVSSVTANANIAADLKRNCAKVDFTIRNGSTGTDVVTVDYVILKSAPAVSYWFNAGSLSDIFPENLSSLGTIDYPQISWSEGTGSSSTEKTFTWYVPANKRGVYSGSTDPKYKYVWAPEGSTYVEVYAHYGSGFLSSYRFYLGANFTTDFNLLPNCAYTYTVDLDSKGNETADGRVSDWGLKDFTPDSVERANCYILNPAPSDTRDFRIPVDKVNAFWGGGKYEDISNYSLDPSKGSQGWTVEIVWADFNPATTTGFNLSKSTGTSYNEYFTVTVPAGLSGNAVVGIRKTDDTATPATYLWSWHLWITDYDPDSTPGLAPASGRYEYSVNGGHLHRYTGTVWDSGGKYEKSFIMDRNLGALGTTFQNADRGTLLYQFGRKDPFPTGKYTLYGKLTSVGKADEAAANSDHHNVPYSVRNPLTYLYTSNDNQAGISYWTFGDIYNPSKYDSSILWQDPETGTGGSNVGGKSFFDPCPPGWTVPAGITDNGIFGCFKTGYCIKISYDGQYFYPNGTSDTSTGTIFLPYDGSYWRDSASYKSQGLILGIYYANPADAGKSFAFYHNISSSSSTFGTKASYSRTQGWSVRCIRK